MKYTITFETPWGLSPYEVITLQERIERNIKSFISDECQVNYISKNE